MFNFKKSLFFFVVLTITILSIQQSYGSSSSFYWRPDVHFNLSACNSSVTFTDYYSFANFTWNDLNASKITFNGAAQPTYILYQPYNFTEIYVNSSLSINASLGFQNQNYTVGAESLLLNMRYEAIKNGTIYEQGKNELLKRLLATISNITGEATVQIWTNNYRPRWVKVDCVYLDSSKWSWDDSTSILTFKLTAASDRYVQGIFGITEEEGATITILGSIVSFLLTLRKKIYEKISKFK